MFPEGEVVMAKETWKRQLELEAGRSHLQPHVKSRELDLELEWGYKLSKSTPGNILPPARLRVLKVPQHLK